MKKLFATLLVTCVALSAAAVDIPKQGFGLHIGWAQPTLRLNDNTSKDSLSHHIHLNGFKVGVTYDASYVAGFGSSMGINYTFGMQNSGWASTNPSFNQYPKSRNIITYSEIELFVDWQYKFEVAKETYLILYTGPTIQCGLSLIWRKDQLTEDPITGDITYTRGDRRNAYKSTDENSFKRLNVTWGVGAGFQYKRYFLRGGYDFGLLNPYKLTDFVNGTHTRGRFDQWQIKIGMYLWYED
jgi:hypothetical protein